MKLPPLLKYLKNEIDSLYPWLFLVELTLPDGTTYHFVHNTENIIFEGIEYIAFPFQLELPEFNSEGNYGTWYFNVDNTERVFMYDLERLKGAVDSQITITIVNAGYLQDGYIDNQFRITVLETRFSSNWVTFVCGGPNLFRVQFPPYRYFANHCIWNFGWHECYYNDPTATTVWGTDGRIYICYRSHISSEENQPVTGLKWYQYWRLVKRGEIYIGNFLYPDVWQAGVNYSAGTMTCKKTLADCRAKNNSHRFGGFPGLQGGVRIV